MREASLGEPARAERVASPSRPPFYPISRPGAREGSRFASLGPIRPLARASQSLWKSGSFLTALHSAYAKVGHQLLPPCSSAQLGSKERDSGAMAAGPRQTEGHRHVPLTALAFYTPPLVPLLDVVLPCPAPVGRVVVGWCKSTGNPLAIVFLHVSISKGCSES
ncbi:hypothetical protein GQ53DRAFT_285255 [Thozetella sp. PMI_491]|nr:hypothetical protein GQ53DRAFT_285255 [Thozetella sp. PMI_491]